MALMVGAYHWLGPNRPKQVVFASAPESLLVQMLLQSPGVGLMDFAQSEAYARRFGFMTP